MFSIRNGQIVPEHFTGDDGTDSKRRDQDLVFDWEHGRVTGIAETQPVDLPLQPGLQDGMSVQVALIHALLAGHTPSRVPDGRQDQDQGIRLHARKARQTVQTRTGRAPDRHLPQQPAGLSRMAPGSGARRSWASCR